MTLNGGSRRRRGRELEDAILQAAWDRLAEVGYADFTFDAVARRAGTSRPVLYRRWDDRDALARAAIVRQVRIRRERPVPDTGSLRGDVLELMRGSNLHGEESIALLVIVIGAFHLATGRTIAEIREEALGEAARGAMDVVLDRAAARGEVDEARLTPRVRAVAFDLFRHDLLVTMRPLTEEDIVAIVDEVFLPLVARR